MIASVVQPVSRYGYSFAKIALTRRSIPDPNGWVRKIHPFTKSRSPLKISAKIIRGKIFWFFCAAGFQNNSKRFWRLTENPGKLFSRARNLRKFFPGKIRTRAHRQPELFPTTQKRGKPSKTPQFSEVIAIVGTGRASGSLFCTF